MFIRRRDWELLNAKVANHERKLGIHEKFLKNDHEKIKAHDEQLEAVREETGASDPIPHLRDGYFMPNIFEYYLGTRSSRREAKPFNLKQKIDAIMDHLGLTEQVSAETKLVKKPVEKKKKGTK